MMKSLYLLFALFVIVDHAAAQTSSSFPFTAFERMFTTLAEEYGTATKDGSVPATTNNVPTSAQLVDYYDGDLKLIGYLSYPTGTNFTGNPRPGIIIAHDWNGRDQYENDRADQLARMGYVAFAYDIYGRVGTTREDNLSLMTPLARNRTILKRRLDLALQQMNKFADNNKIGAIGYCFGGMAALDMARYDMVKAVVSFHGSLDPLPNAHPTPINAKILLCHGHEDKSITPDKVLDLESEMTNRRADWQVIIYGNGTDHAFTVPGPRYNANSDRRSWLAMTNFFNEAFSHDRSQQGAQFINM